MGLTNTVPILLLLWPGAGAGLAQSTAASIPPLSAGEKFQFHANQNFNLPSLASRSAGAGLMQWRDRPEQWGQGAGGYANRFGSMTATAGIRTTLAAGLNTGLHQDPRYFRATRTGFWPRFKHAARGTILTRTDLGGETLSTWRLGSAYGAAFLSATWQPGESGIVRRGLAGGSMQMGFAFANNLFAEFWPDIKRKLSRKKRASQSSQEDRDGQ
jgi:hypothetical protein